MNLKKQESVFEFLLFLLQFLQICLLTIASHGFSIGKYPKVSTPLISAISYMLWRHAVRFSSESISAYASGTEYDTCRAAPCIFIKILQELTKYLHGKTS